MGGDRIGDGGILGWQSGAMFAHGLIVHILSIVLLACPFFCLGKGAARSCGTFSCIYDGCCGCRNPFGRRDAPGDRRPESVADCLCKGAILPSSEVNGGDIDASSSLLTPLGLDRQPIAVSALGVGLFQRRHFLGGPFSGRDLCALICSRLL